MAYFKTALALFLIAVVALSTGCIRKSETERRIVEDFQTYLDSPYDTADENSLTAEERAVIEGFTVYRNILKIQLAQETEQTMVEPIAEKTITKFAFICRGYTYLETQYVGEIRMMAEVNDKVDNFLIAEITFQNRSDRTNLQEYNPSRQ